MAHGVAVAGVPFVPLGSPERGVRVAHSLGIVGLDAEGREGRRNRSGGGGAERPVSQSAGPVEGLLDTLAVLQLETRRLASLVPLREGGENGGRIGRGDIAFSGGGMDLDHDVGNLGEI